MQCLYILPGPPKLPQTRIIHSTNPHSVPSQRKLLRSDLVNSEKVQIQMPLKTIKVTSVK